MSTTFESSWENERLQEELTTLRTKLAEAQAKLQEAERDTLLEAADWFEREFEGEDLFVVENLRRMAEED